MGNQTNLSDVAMGDAVEVDIVCGVFVIEDSNVQTDEIEGER